MKFSIIHEIKGRMRIHVMQRGMSCEQADTLCYYLNKQEFVISAKVRERTQDAVVGRLYYVSSWHWGNIRRVDAQEVCR